MIRVGLVSCSSTKLAASSRAEPPTARELYCSPLFRSSLRYSLARCDVTYVLSAKHGLLGLDELVRPYELKLSALDWLQRDAWGAAIVCAIVRAHPEPRELVILAGRLYVDPIRRHTAYGHPDLWRISEPLAGMQIGQRLHHLREVSPP